jgi:hypothetical protein
MCDTSNTTKDGASESALSSTPLRDAQQQLKLNETDRPVEITNPVQNKKPRTEQTPPTLYLYGIKGHGLSQPQPGGHSVPFGTAKLNMLLTSRFLAPPSPTGVCFPVASMK